MAQISRCFSASFAFLTLRMCLAHADAQVVPHSKPVPEKAFISETSRDGRVLVKVTQGRDGRRETLIIKSGRGIYRASDERLSGYNNEDYSYDHDFYLSPDAKWLFVTRKLFHTTDIAYLYHLKGTRLVKVRPQGRRFDEAALKFFSSHLRFPYDAVGEGRRVIYFLRWTADSKHLVFDFHSTRNFESTRYWLTEGDYDLKLSRFSLISLRTESD